MRGTSGIVAAWLPLPTIRRVPVPAFEPEIFDVDVDAARLTDPPPAQPQQDCHRGVVVGPVVGDAIGAP